MEKDLDLLNRYYEVCFQDLRQTKQIEHLPDEILEVIPAKPNKYSIGGIVEQENSIGITYRTIALIY